MGLLPELAWLTARATPAELKLPVAPVTSAAIAGWGLIWAADDNNGKPKSPAIAPKGNNTQLPHKDFFSLTKFLPKKVFF